jgi:hypothetical protein
MRFWIEAGLGSISSVLVIATLVWPDWLELVLHIDPDGGNGAVEWAVVAVFTLVSVASFALARVDWRRAHLVGATS